MALSSHCPHIVKANFSFCNQITDDGLVSFVQSCPLLEDLKLSRVNRITDVGMKTIANDCKFGLAAGVWTRDLARAHHFVRCIEAGSIWVNIYRQPRYELPFGGFKDSGYGHDDLIEFTREKAAIIAS
jgi:hypothetical protein